MVEESAARSVKLPVFGNPVAYRADLTGSVDAMINEAMKLSRDDDFVLIIKDSREIEKRLLAAYVSAVIRHNDNSMHSKSLSLETMLFAAGTMNIGNAVGKVKASSRFIVFSTKEKLAQELFSRFGIRKPRKCSLELDPAITSDVALAAIREDK
jgi:tRNA threonylcarbamoyladenosine modification (KEOPS) complex Cgi121 subunit